jgi:hypothetical protein
MGQGAELSPNHNLYSGGLKTAISRNVKTFSLENLILHIFQVHEPEVGVLTQLWAGTSHEGAEMNGKARSTISVLVFVAHVVSLL